MPRGYNSANSMPRDKFDHPSAIVSCGLRIWNDRVDDDPRQRPPVFIATPPADRTTSRMLRPT